MSLDQLIYIDVAVPANMKCGELSKEAVEGEELILPK